MEPLGGPSSTQCTPLEEYCRPPSEFSKGKPLATSSALDVASGSPLENSLGDLQSSP